MSKVNSLPVIVVEHANYVGMDNVDTNTRSNDATCREATYQVDGTPKRKNSDKSKCFVFSASKIKPDSADRFIANRKFLNRDYATFKLGPPPSPSDWLLSDEVFEDSPKTSPSVAHEQYRRRMACMSEGASEARVLNFGSTGRLSTSKGSSRSQQNFDPNMTFKKTVRPLPKEPEQVLDLPEIENNFFTNTVSWGSRNHVVAALGLGLYVTRKDKDSAASRLTIHKEYRFTSVACSSDGSLVAAGTEGGDLQVWDIEYKKRLLTIDNHHECSADNHESGVLYKCSVGCICWKPNSNIFAIGCRDGYLNHYDCRSGEMVLSNTFHRDALICGLSFSPSGNFLASTDTSYWLKVWDWTGKNACFSKRKAHTASCRALVWNPSKSGCLVSGGGTGDGFIRIWNVYSGEKISEVNMRSQVCSLVWSPLTSELIVSCSRGPGKHMVSVMSYPGLTFIGNLPGHNGRVLHMGMGLSKTVLFTASADEMLKFWKISESRDPAAVRSGSCTFLSKLR